MKRRTSTTAAIAIAAGFVAATLATTVHAAAPALQGQVKLRPLTPQEVKDYSLGSAQLASGLSTIGRGQPAYLDALVNAAIPKSNIVSVTFTLLSKPALSTATLTDSPLGTNVPPYDIADRVSSSGAAYDQVAGRALLIPDVTGKYVVKGTIVTDNGSGTASFTNTITAGTYMGVSTCETCHSGGNLAPDIYNPWNGTLHAHAFEEAITGVSTDHFSQNCISCHVLGFDKSVVATNGGFDDIALSSGWVFPPTLDPTNYAAMPAALRNVSNIQCENCHGAGSEHAIGELFAPNSPEAKAAIAVGFGSGNCSQCHDSLTHHFKSAEWKNSGHASPPRQTGSSCVRCHTAEGFERYVEGAPAVATSFEAITCAACHDPHDATNPHQVRNVGPITLMDNKTTITNAGLGMLCMNCHMSRQDATNYVEVTAGSERFGPHHGPQSDMLEGVNAITYGNVIPSSAHKNSVTNTCVTCHMQEVTSGPAFTHAGGHTFRLAWESGTNNVEVVSACVQCHGNIDTFDLKRLDYDGNGVVDGVQTEVKGLLGRLAYLLPPVGTPKSSISITASWTKQQLRAGYNYQFVLEDGSFGIHNTAYAVGLLKASIADLTGDANNDSLPDSWQIANFGSITDPNASPYATPANDGIPNWLKYNLGLDPKVAGINLPGGVVWVNGTSIVNSTNIDTIAIYTAAEVAFDTVPGTTYQIQGISDLKGSWQNIGGPIQGTGGSISYVTPTRKDAQQFFRVVHTP